MRKKHFEAIAAALEFTRPSGGDALEQWRSCVEAVTLAVATSNPAFDRERFLKACGYAS